uniref:Proline-rich peptide 10b-MK n=1 Tax=Bitis nasicornis TaxID=8695 RepID=BPPAB_BITNA
QNWPRPQIPPMK